MADIYQNWRDRLAGKDVPVVEDRPDPGRYKMRRHRDAPWLPVAIGRDPDGNIVALVDGKVEDPLKIWTWCAKNPVSADAYNARIKDGHWPDESKPVALSNMPADPFERLKAESDDKLEQLKALAAKGIADQTDCDKATNIQRQLAELNRQADAMFKAEKQPHLDAGRAVDEKFRFREKLVSAQAFARTKLVEPFLKAKEKREREEAERKFREEQARIAAERERIQAERAKHIADEPVLALTDPEPELPEMPTAPEPVKVQSGGGVGRKAGLRTVWVPVMTDYPAALAHFAENAKVKELIQTLGAQAVKAGARSVPGFEIKEDRKAA